MNDANESAKLAAQPSRRSGESELLVALSGQFWDLRVLHISGWYSLLMPWPLPWLAYLVPTLRAYFRRGSRASWTYSNLASTITLLCVGLGSLLDDSNSDALKSIDPHWDWVANTLLLGATMIAGLMGVSLAMPGSSLIRITAEMDARLIVEYTEPYLWAFVCCSVGVIVAYLKYSMIWSATLAWLNLPDYWQIPGAITIFAAMALLQALLNAIRTFVLALYLVNARDSVDQK